MKFYSIPNVRKFGRVNFNKDASKIVVMTYGFWTTSSVMVFDTIGNIKMSFIVPDFYDWNMRYDFLHVNYAYIATQGAWTKA